MSANDLTDADSAAGLGAVWDLGGIIYRYFTEVLLDEAPARGWSLDGIPFGPTGRLPDPEYERMNDGQIDEPAYLDIVHGRLAAHGIDVHIPSEIDWPQQTRPAAIELLAALQTAGRPQALLTNDATSWLGERWWETWAPARYFDAIVDVATLGVRKPAPEPYLAGAERLGLPPQRCIFVDDMRVNCRGAEAVGMASHHVDVRDAEHSLSQLAERLGIGHIRA